MTYMINARLDGNAPSLTLTDTATGQVRLQWRGNGGARDWRRLFARLVLLSCAGRIQLIERAKSAHFGEECLECSDCVDHPAAPLMERFELEHKQTGFPPASPLPLLKRGPPPHHEMPGFYNASQEQLRSGVDLHSTVTK